MLDWVHYQTTIDNIITDSIINNDSNSDRVIRLLIDL